MRILWLKTELLHPIDKGGKIRTYEMLRELRRKHHVTYLSLDDGTASTDARQRAAEYCHELITVPHNPPAKGSIGFYLALARNLASPLPYAVAKYRSAEMTRTIVDTVKTGAFDVIVCDFLSPSLNMPSVAGVPLVLFQHNVEAMIWERHTSVARNPITRWYFRGQWRRMVAWERRECRRVDHVITVSETDCDVIREQYGIISVSSIPTGVDTQYFAPAGREARRPHEIVFTGSMDWMPNEEGIVWFCESVLPLIRRDVPDAALAIVGRNPTGRIRALSGQYPGVEVTGTVPDIRPFLERAGVLIVPLRVGSGTRLKIYEGMAMARPTVSTSVGAEGLPLEHGVELLLADDAETFAKSVARVLDDPDLGATLGDRASARVRRDFSWAHVADQFAAICELAVARHHQTGPVVGSMT